MRYDDMKDGWWSINIWDRIRNEPKFSVSEKEK